MTAVLYDELMMTAAAAPKQPIAAGSDPLVDAVARVLTVPLRQAYAALWRIGLLEVGRR